MNKFRVFSKEIIGQELYDLKTIEEFFDNFNLSKIILKKLTHMENFKIFLSEFYRVLSINHFRDTQQP